MLGRSSLFKKLLPVAAVAATMAWAGAANASIVLDDNGNVEFGIQKKLAVDDDGNDVSDLLFVSNIYVRFSEADDRLLNIGFSSLHTKNDSPWYQHGFGGNTAPNSLLVLAFPGLAFDTFVTIGLKVNPGGDTDTTSTDADFVMGPNRITGGWFHAVDAGQGDAINSELKEDGNYWVLVAQLTVEAKPGNGVFGSMIVFWQEAIGEPDQNDTGSFDNQVPSPGALALLGLAGLVGAHRRRRR